MSEVKPPEMRNKLKLLINFVGVNSSPSVTIKKVARTISAEEQALIDKKLSPVVVK